MANASPAAGDGAAAADPLQPPADGVGPLVQRDYWALLDDCRCSPTELMDAVRAQFTQLPPPEIVVFERCDGDGALELGDELDIQIRLAGPARVRVVHADACSVTLATLVGHPEAGRITFGAYRNRDGDVIFHIRSRARSSTRLNYVGFMFGGDPMQTSTWTDFVKNVALTCAAGVAGQVHADTVAIAPEALDAGDELLDRPTFLARAD